MLEYIAHVLSPGTWKNKLCSQQAILVIGVGVFVFFCHLLVMLKLGFQGWGDSSVHQDLSLNTRTQAKEDWVGKV